MTRIAVPLFISLIILSFSDTAYAQTKPADLAGSWYSADGEELSAALDTYLDAASVPEIKGRVFAIISPHAGIVYSGPVAAYGYKLLSVVKPKTVIVVGFSHRKFFDGISVYSAGEFKTPLGNLTIDEEMATLLIKKSERLKFYPGLFENENSVELQLPFIKKVMPDVKLVPVAFGVSNLEDAKTLAGILSGILSQNREVVVIASTDMSHFNSYEEANTIDAETIELMKRFDFKQIYAKGVSHQQPCCGYMPVACVLMMAKEIKADNFTVLKYANSGDTAGDKRQVVGYLSAVIYKSDENIRVSEYQGISKDGEEGRMLNDIQRKRLLQIARESITSYVRDGKRNVFSESDPILNKPLGVFVTLHESGSLRGCIGNMVSSGPLYKTVADMAIEAATADPRFPRLSASEIDKIDIEISVLSQMQRVKDASLIKIPGHGVLVKKGFRSGVYLPQVADETGWGKEEFLNSLCAHKAGLSADAWKDSNTELYVFSAEVFGEE